MSPSKVIPYEVATLGTLHTSDFASSPELVEYSQDSWVSAHLEAWGKSIFHDSVVEQGQHSGRLQGIWEEFIGKVSECEPLRILHSHTAFCRTETGREQRQGNSNRLSPNCARRKGIGDRLWPSLAHAFKGLRNPESHVISGTAQLGGVVAYY